MPKITKEELLDKLKNGLSGDQERDHAYGEDLLLSFINDEEISTAWAKASENW